MDSLAIDLHRQLALIRRAGFTRKDLAQRAGVRPETVSRVFSLLRPGGAFEAVVRAAGELAVEAEAACT